jgi:hypothetical protein
VFTLPCALISAYPLVSPPSSRVVTLRAKWVMGLTVDASNDAAHKKRSHVQPVESATFE